MADRPPREADRRRHRRAELELPVAVYDASGRARLTTGTTLNVSPGGVLLHCPEASAELMSGQCKVGFGLAPPAAGLQQRLFDYRSVRVDGDAPLRCALQVVGEPPDFMHVPEFVGRHQSICAIKQKLLSIAGHDVNVLVQGESGTGKNVVADLIHRYSRRADSLVIRVNCPAIPDKLLESQLFGHEKGAFTDAASAQPGLFRIARHGTLVLDEISAIPVDMQAKLLQAIEEKSFIPVGGRETVEVDVRIISTTNDDLKQRIAEGTFRQDLFYRLNQTSITVPPLRERGDDVLLLAEHFLRRYSEQFAKQYRPFDESTLELFRSYSWPGNVRELENAIRSGVITGHFASDDFEGAPGAEPKAAPAREDPPWRGASQQSIKAAREEAIAEAERQVVIEALEATGYNKTQAAARLGVSYRTLLRKLKRYNIKT
jgi:two-component system response regulator AtoC